MKKTTGQRPARPYPHTVQTVCVFCFGFLCLEAIYSDKTMQQFLQAAYFPHVILFLRLCV